mmetsp:Transcript_37776/g.79116  ORF Transcript_37776/g.79116 Transcript_37776/m.79116 type:complete len:89 (+) Transcript_37776:1734-2000(+)
MAQSSQPVRREVFLRVCNDGMKVAFGRSPASHSSVRRTSMRTANWPDAQRDADSAALSIVVYASAYRDSARRMQVTISVVIFILLLWW